MGSGRTFAAVVLLVAVATALAVPISFQPESYSRAEKFGFTKTALDEYVEAPDPSFKFEIISNNSGIGYHRYVINMTSQAWLTPNISSQPIWWHYMVLIVPGKLDYKFKNTGLMYITGGSNTGAPPDGKDEDELLATTIAITDQCMAMVLFQVPNEPIYFNAEQPPKRRTEDAIIAYTWNHFFNNPSEPNWLLRLPMTKAAVRGLDTFTAVAKILGEDVTQFMVAGASKRGWTTWTTGAVDTRVVAIVPLVMDLLNMYENIHHMYRNLGGWTFAFKDYYAENFTARIDEPCFKQMAAIVDPFAYKDRLTMPKLVVDSGGDEFFQPDDNYFWWDEMVGEKHLLMLQDAEHSLATAIPEVITGISSFLYGLLSDTPRPEMTWTFNDTYAGSSILLTVSEAPTHIYVRYADTLDGDRRDWRLITGQDPCPSIKVSGACLHPVLWHELDPIQTGEHTYEIAFNNPAVGWRAFFIEAKFRGVTAFPFVFTTQVNIIPHTYPFPDCHGEECRGTLV